mmetsp:Transcript_33254/g.105275  ORF Transcript_33254/g.105275 Transcript_33254/m.105275 type:complete len:201 (-) Transcript_33254:1073-1675(-)
MRSGMGSQTTSSRSLARTAMLSWHPSAGRVSALSWARTPLCQKLPVASCGALMFRHSRWVRRRSGTAPHGACSRAGAGHGLKPPSPNARWQRWAAVRQLRAERPERLACCPVQRPARLGSSASPPSQALRRRLRARAARRHPTCCRVAPRPMMPVRRRRARSRWLARAMPRPALHACSRRRATAGNWTGWRWREPQTAGH